MADTKQKQTTNKGPKPKSLNKMLAEIEKAKKQIAKASSSGEDTIDITKFDGLVAKATQDIADGMGLPIRMLKVSADVIIDGKELATE
jgi:hypothetical protein